MSETNKKRFITWSLTADFLTLSADVLGAKKLDFYIPDFWKTSNFIRLEDVEKATVVNGLKQKLSDKTAVGKDMANGDERVKLLEETWKRLCEKRQWNKPGEGRKTITTKIDAALAKATAEELAMMLKLGLIDQAKYDAAIAAKVAEAAVESGEVEAGMEEFTEEVEEN